MHHSLVDRVPCILGGGRFCIQGGPASGGSTSREVCIGGSASRGVCILGQLDKPPGLLQEGLGRPPAHVTCDACWEANFPMGRMTYACENITLPQTSIAGGGNNIEIAPTQAMKPAYTPAKRVKGMVLLTILTSYGAPNNI